jgi:hypothetical protein
MKVYNKFTEQQDNIICTFVRMYSFNVGYGLLRASQYLGLRYSTVSSRYYKVLRDTRKIFGYSFGDKMVWNTRSISRKELEELKAHEGTINAEMFNELDKRNWWHEE